MKRLPLCLWLLIAVLFLWAHSSNAQPTALVGPTALNPADSTVIEDATILLEGDIIWTLGPSGEVVVPEEATVHRMPDKYVMPGLIDGHVHFFQSGGLYTRPDAIDLRAVRPYSEELRRIKEQLPDTFRRYLRSGITSAVDVGGPMWNLDVRARADTTAMAPTVEVAGSLISSVSRPSLDLGDPPILKITDPEAARQEVREQVDAGVDLIKIWYIVRGNETPADYRPVVEAVVDEAHAAGKRVAVHATELETARAAVEAGADILVHSVFNKPVDNAFVRLLRKNDVLYTPTLMVGERYRETFAQQLDLTTPEHHIGQKDVIGSLFDLRTLPDSLVPAALRQRIEQAPTIASDTVAMRNLKRLHDAGIPIAAGTDAGNIGTPHGPALFREFELMRTAGLTPREILATATAGGARLLGRNDLGQLEAGMQADLVVLNENPLADISNAASIHRVVKEGRVYAPQDLTPRPPEAVVQQGANAFNAHDLGGFLDAFAPDLKVYEHPNALVMESRAPLREQYASSFQTHSDLHVQVRHEAPMGNTVVLHEVITGGPSDSPIEQVVLYHVADGVIDRVWLVQEDGRAPTGEAPGRLLKIETPPSGTDQKVEYSVAVDGSVEKGPWANSHDEISAGRVSGTIFPPGGGDSFRATGHITRFQSSRPVELINEVDPTGRQHSTGQTRRLVRIEAPPGSTARIEYSFTVDGSVEEGPWANSHDKISGQRVSGKITPPGGDSYYVTGHITTLRASHPVSLISEGESAIEDAH